MADEPLTAQVDPKEMVNVYRPQPGIAPPPGGAGRRRLFQDPQTGDKWAIPYDTTPPSMDEALRAIRTGKAEKVGAAPPAQEPGAPASGAPAAAAAPPAEAAASPETPGIRPPPGAVQETPPAKGSSIPWLLKSGGGALGGAGGMALGGMAGGVGAVPGALAGAGLGTAAGGTLSRILGYEPPPPTVSRAALQTASEIFQGAEGEMGGRALGAVAGKAIPPAARAAAQAFASTADKLKIPMRAGDVTMGRGIQRLEGIPSYFTVGAGAVQRFAMRQITAADEAVQRMISSMGPATSTRVAGLNAKDATTAALGAWKKEMTTGFNAIDQAVGDQPLVPVKNIRAALEQILEQSRISPMGPPQGAARVAGSLATVPGGAVGASGKSTPLDLSKLPPHLQELFEVDKVPFKVAREIAAQFREMGKAGGSPVGTIRQGQSKYLSGAMERDIQEFMSGQPGEVKGPYEAIRQAYRVGKDKFNRSLYAAILNKKVDPEKVVRNIFSPGDIDTTLDFKTVASDPLYKKLTVAWMADILERSMTPKLAVQGTPASFSPASFVKQMEPYIRSGHLDVILDPATAKYVKDLVNVFGRLGRAEGLAGSSGGGMGGHMAVGQLHQIVRLGASPMMAAGGYSVGGVPGAAAGVATPWALGKLTTSPRVIDWLIAGYGDRWPRETLRIAAHMLSQGAQELSPNAETLESNAKQSP